MTLAGKKLQDIYDSGVAMLSSLEKETAEDLEKKKDQHLHDFKDSIDQSSQNLKDKSSILQAEFKQSINESLEKIQKALTVEEAQNKVFVESLLAELNAVAEQLKLKLRILKQAHQENVDFASTTAVERYFNSVEEVRLNIEQAASQSMQGLSAHGKMVWDSLQQTLEQTLIQAGNNANNATDTFMTSTRTQVGQIGSHVSELTKTLSSNCRGRLEQIEKAVREVNDQVEASARTLLETINDHANTIEQQVNNTYSLVGDNHVRSAEALLGNYADNLRILHDDTTKQLIKVADELATNLHTESVAAHVQLRQHSDDLINNVGTLFSGFKKRIEERLTQSRGQKQILENDISKVAEAVQVELNSIRDAFSGKIADLLQNAKLDLNKMTDSIESQMLATADNYNQRMNTNADDIQKQIQADVQKFIQELESVKVAAIDEISAAGGDKENKQ